MFRCGDNTAVVNDRPAKRTKVAHLVYLDGVRFCIQKEDIDGLREAAIRMRENLATIPGSPREDVLSGLMRR